MTQAPRIAVVANELEAEPTGVGRYLRGLLSGIAELALDWRWLLCFQGDRLPETLIEAPCVEHWFAHTRGSAVRWEQLTLARQLRRLRPDLVFSPGYSIPLIGRTPAVVTMHDLSFEILGNEFRWRERWRRRVLARLACRRAARVVVDTESMKQQLCRHYGMMPEKVGVVPLAVEPLFFSSPDAAKDQALVASMGLRRPYLVMVGSVLPRRQPRLVLELLQQLRRQRPELQLVMVGANRLPQPRVLAEWITELELSEAVIQLGWVDDKRLPALYRAAEMSLYLSSYEGFGLPPMESLALGTPALVSTGLGLDELCPSYPFRCTSFTLEEVVAVARRILAEPERSAAAVTRARDELKKLTWKTVATQLVAVLEKALQR